MRKVMIDCKQNIPCNPCKFSCPVNAIEMENITDEPKVIEETCTGCGICVAACPGQACFVVDLDFSEDKASIDFPYEYLPLPEVGSTVKATDNEGTILCEGIVDKVKDIKKFNKTRLVTIVVSKDKVRDVRGIRPVK